VFNFPSLSVWLEATQGDIIMATTTTNTMYEPRYCNTTVLLLTGYNYLSSI